ncbi:MAG TPA: tRNA lysidine(34) synthetase TilS, partial [Azospira sp.]|nr:tRNA lysidine(34) synthetase TilS [Azospira sp.]
PRADLEAWLAAQGLAWIEDESNADTAYARNFLRQEALPLLQSRFPAAASLARAARLAGEAEELLEELAAQDLAAAAVGGQLQASALQALAEPRGRNLLRCWLRRHGAPMPEAQALAELWRQLQCPRPDGQVEWRCADWVVRVWRGAVFLDHEPLPTASFLAAGESPFVLPAPWPFGVIEGRLAAGQGVAARLCDASARFRLRQGGETLQLPGRPRRPLKKLLQEADIPPWQRQRLPLLWLGGTLAWVPGLGTAAACLPREGEDGWVLEWRPGSAAP